MFGPSGSSQQCTSHRSLRKLFDAVTTGTLSVSGLFLCRSSKTARYDLLGYMRFLVPMPIPIFRKQENSDIRSIGQYSICNNLHVVIKYM